MRLEAEKILKNLKGDLFAVQLREPNFDVRGWIFMGRQAEGNRLSIEGILCDAEIDGFEGENGVYTCDDGRVLEIRSIVPDACIVHGGISRRADHIDFIWDGVDMRKQPLRFIQLLDERMELDYTDSTLATRDLISALEKGEDAVIG